MRSKQVVRRVREPRIRKLAGVGSAPQPGCTPEYEQSGVRLNLSSTQCKVFKVGKRLGAGAFATVYESAKYPNRVVKFTSDANDAAAAAILKGKKLSGTVRVYDVAKLEGRDVAGRYNTGMTPIYGIVTERLTPTNDHTDPSMVPFFKAANSFSDSVQSYPLGFNPYGTGPFVPGPSFVLPRNFQRDALARCKTDLAKGWGQSDPALCNTAIPKMTRAMVQAGKKGGIFTQDLHGGNWGVRKNGQIAILDFGISKTDPAARQPVPSLARVPRMARRRRVR
jgi:hypothetical protein